MPKIGYDIERSILEKLLSIKSVVSDFAATTDNHVYYRTDGGLYWKVFTDFPPKFVVNGVVGHSTRETSFQVTKARMIQPMIAALSSNTFWWWYTTTSNCRHLNPYDVQNFPVPSSILDDVCISQLGKKYLSDIHTNSTMLKRSQKQTGQTETQSFKISKSKSIIDEIDTVLAQHYNFTDEELDFIINYDIKYRMGDALFDEG